MFLIIKYWDDVTFALKWAWHEITKYTEQAVKGGIKIIEAWPKAYLQAANVIIGVLNGVIRAWNSLSFRVPKITLPSAKVLGKKIGGGSIGGFSVSLPKLPTIPKIGTSWSLSSAIPSFTAPAPVRQASGGGSNPLDNLTALGNRVIGSASGRGGREREHRRRRIRRGRLRQQGLAGGADEYGR